MNKNIDHKFYKGHPAPSGLSGPKFEIPPVPASIRFSIPQLCASIVRCGNTSSPNVQILRAQARAAEEFIKIFICPKSSKFVVLKTAETLIEAKLMQWEPGLLLGKK